MNHNGQSVFVTEELMRKLEEDRITWHWTPWMRTRTKVHDNEIVEMSCHERDSIDSFPDSIFSGWFGISYMILVLLYLGISFISKLKTIYI